eukprot:3638316-Pyramimonas_sp.AAC.1
MEDGRELDLLAPAPVQVGTLVLRRVAACSDARALRARSASANWARPILWKPLRDIMNGTALPSWGPRQPEALRSVVSRCHWTQERPHRQSYVSSPLCRVCMAAPG